MVKIRMSIECHIVEMASCINFKPPRHLNEWRRGKEFFETLPVATDRQTRREQNELFFSAKQSPPPPTLPTEMLSEFGINQTLVWSESMTHIYWSEKEHKCIPVLNRMIPCIFATIQWSNSLVPLNLLVFPLLTLGSWRHFPKNVFLVPESFRCTS